MTEYRKGMLVTNPKCAHWGPGKIVNVSDAKVWVVFRDLPEREAKQIVTTVVQLAPYDGRDAVLDNLPPLQKEGDKWVLPRPRMVFSHALQKFLNLYPQGFTDANYLGNRHVGERNYKLAAHNLYVQELGDGKGERLLQEGQIEELTRKATSVVGRTNLLASFEAIALRDALREGEAAREFFRTLLPFIANGPSEESFAPYRDAVMGLPAKGLKVFTWPVVTILPYLARPELHMFLKPSATQEAAALLGFDLRYDASPNWTTYEALLRMGNTYFELLQGHGARDLIDVQSFIWVTCGSDR